MYKSIPTYESGNWTDTIFQTEQEFIDFLLSIFKIPGEYLMSLMKKQQGLMIKVIIAMLHIGQKILQSIGMIKKINVEMALYITMMVSHGI